MNLLSWVPDAKIKSVLVPVRPERLLVPVFGIPSFVSSLYSPKGTFHKIFPSFKFNATIEPQGGLIAGKFLLSLN